MESLETVRESFGSNIGPIGSCQGLFCSHFFIQLGPFGSHLGQCGSNLGPFGSHLRPIWSHLGPFRSYMRPFGVI